MSKTFELSPSSLSMSQDVEVAIINKTRTLCDYAAQSADGACSFFFACLHAAHHEGILSRLSLDGSKLTSESRATLKDWRIAQGVIADSPRDELSRVIRLAVIVLANGEHDWRNAASRKDLASMANDKVVEVISATESLIQNDERLARADAAAAAAAAALVFEQHQRQQADAAAAAAAAALVAEQALQAQLGEIDQLRAELANVRAELASVRAELATATAAAAATATAKRDGVRQSA